MAVQKEIKEARRVIEKSGKQSVEFTLKTPQGVWLDEQLPSKLKGFAVVWHFVFHHLRGNKATFVGEKKD